MGFAFAFGMAVVRFFFTKEHRDATRLLKSDRGDVTHPANAGWSYGRKPHSQDLVDLVADAIARDEPVKCNNAISSSIFPSGP